MKLRFKLGKQKEFLYMIKGGKTWSQLSIETKIAEYTLKSFAFEKVLMSDKIFNELPKNYLYKKYIIERLPLNWGQKKGGNLSTGTLKEIAYPKESKELAELIGIILGDGNIHVFQGKSTSHMVRIAGDSNKDRDYLLNHVKPLFETLFKIECKIHKHKSFNALYIIINSKKVVEFLLDKGLVAGNKIKQGVGIPYWIKKKKSWYAACIRGLMDTDGSLYLLKPHWPNIMQICFTNRNLVLLNEVKEGLEILDIRCSKICYKTNTPKIYVTQKKAVRKFYKVVSFRNNKHLHKIAP